MFRLEGSFGSVITSCRIQKSSRMSLRLRMNSISGDSHVILTSFPRSKSCGCPITKQIMQMSVIHSFLDIACAIAKCMNHVCDDFGSGWVTLSVDGSFGLFEGCSYYRSVISYATHYSDTPLLCPHIANSLFLMHRLLLCGISSKHFVQRSSQ